MDGMIEEEEEVKALFICPQCWKRIPNYKLSEIRYILYITFTCSCSPKSIQLGLDDYLKQIKTKAIIKSHCTINPSHKKPAIVFSLKSRNFLCVDCKIVSLKLNRDDILLNQEMHILIQCRNHPTKDVSLYCSTCSMLICSKCLKTGHMNHNIKYFSMIDQEITKRLNDAGYYGKYKTKNDKKVQELMQGNLTEEERKMLQEVVKFNADNNELLSMLIGVLSYTYTTIKNQPDENLIRGLMKFSYSFDMNIDQLTYVHYLTYMENHLLIQSIKTQFTHVNITEGFKGDILSVILLSDKKRLAVGISDGISIYSLQNMPLPTVEKTVSTSNLCCCIEASINGINYLFIGCSDNITAIQSSTFSNETKKIIYHEGSTCLLSLGNDMIAAGTNTNNVVLLNCSDISKATFIYVLEKHTEFITCMLNYDNKLVSTSVNTFLVWNLDDNTSLEKTVNSHIRSVRLLNSTTMLIGEENGVISGWDIAQYEKIGEAVCNQGDTLCNLLLINNNEWLIAGYEKYKMLFKVTQQNKAISLVQFYVIINNQEDWCISLIAIQDNYFLSSVYRSFDLYEISNKIQEDDVPIDANKDIEGEIIELFF